MEVCKLHTFYTNEKFGFFDKICLTSSTHSCSSLTATTDYETFKATKHLSIADKSIGCAFVVYRSTMSMATFGLSMTYYCFFTMTTEWVRHLSNGYLILNWFYSRLLTTDRSIMRSFTCTSLFPFILNKSTYSFA